MRRLTEEQKSNILKLKEYGIGPTLISDVLGLSRRTVEYWYYPNVRESFKKPDIRERQRKYKGEYDKRPEVKKHQRKYRKEYFKRPDVIDHIKERVTKRKLIIDVFTDFKTAYSFEDIRKECGGKPKNITEELQLYTDSSILIKTFENEKEVYRLNPSSPMHVVANKFFKKIEKKLFK